jgi:ubiquinone/menaquinone biosynthesis C-methylase UbiE
MMLLVVVVLQLLLLLSTAVVVAAAGMMPLQAAVHHHRAGATAAAFVANRSTTITITTTTTIHPGQFSSFQPVQQHSSQSRQKRESCFFQLYSRIPTSTNNPRNGRTTNTTTTTTMAQPKVNKAKPRTGLAQQILDWALTSPFWKLVLVPQARKNIVQTAQANGIAWNKCYDWLLKQNGPWNNMEEEEEGEDSSSIFSSSSITATAKEPIHNHHVIATIDYPCYPSYYTKEFHAYPKGNLSWEAAIEQELASRAVGARNFPSHGARGEDVFRSSFEEAILRLGGRVPKGGIVVDFGCGTGISTRRLSKVFPMADKFLGIDLSPYFIAVGQRLLELCPTDEDWVTTIEKNDRIELRVGNVVNTSLDNESVDAVNVSLVIHEMPIDVTLKMCQEAYRILKPGGQLYISEMDFDSPAYAAQRENAMLFSLLRSTEPYLDEYADGVDQVRDYLAKTFQSVKITAATGRHFALVATKGQTVGGGGGGSVVDTRFDSQGNYAVVDTHLKVWESKEQ